MSCLRVAPGNLLRNDNQGLDRAMVVGTPEDREPGFMSEALESVYF